MAGDDLLNPAAVPGHNAPPVEPAPAPFDLSKAEIVDLYNEARNFLDGEPVETQELADAIGKLKRDTAAAMARAEDRRKAEAKPFDDGKAEVQARYNTLIGDTTKVKGLAVLTIDVCNKALVPFLEKQEAEKRRVADAARAEADELRRIADAAMQASRDNLAARERAEHLNREAKEAAKGATKAEKDRPAVRGGGRAITIRTRSIAVLTDPVAALRHAREVWPDDLKAWLVARAQQDMDAGKLTIPGFEVEQKRSAA